MQLVQRLGEGEADLELAPASFLVVPQLHDERERGLQKRDRFAIGEAGLAIRICGSCIASLAEVARGETDGYIGLAERSWDVMAALPIVDALGADSTIDWPRQTLRSELYFACGRKGFLRLMSPLFSGGGLA